MIESNKKKWFNDVFSLFVKERQIRPFFHTINVRADDVPTTWPFPCDPQLVLGRAHPAHAESALLTT